MKVINSNNRVIISPFQIAWNMRHSLAGAQSYILVGGLPNGHVKLFHGCKTLALGQSTIDSVPGLYEGPLKDLDLSSQVSNSQTPLT